MIGHTISESESWFDAIQTLYLNDEAFAFETRNDMIKGITHYICTLIQKSFEMIGLAMHIGRGDTAGLLPQYTHAENQFPNKLEGL